MFTIAFVAMACEAGDIALVKDFVQQWALDHAGQIVKAKAGFGSGDNYVDAALTGYEAVEEIHKADELMEAGREKQDPKKMDEALTLRPRDWTYQLSRSSLALKLGDMTTYDKYLGNAINEAGFVSRIEPNDADRAFHRQNTLELEAVDKQLSIGGPGSVVGFKKYEQCFELYDRLYVLATKGYTNVGTPAAAEAERYKLRRQDCEKLKAG